MSSNTEDDALVDAILAAPQDDGPRLVYADWLIERGDPRGELIGVQCEMARLARERRRHTVEYRTAKERSDALLRAHERAWFDRVIGLSRWEKRVTRGFVSHASISAKALQVRWERFARMPLEEVTFHRRLTALEHGPMGSPEIGRVAWLMREAGGRRLTALGLATNTGLTTYAPTVLAAALAGVRDGDEALAWPHGDWPDRRLWPAMRALDLLDRGLGARFVREPPPELGGLEVLRLRLAPEEASALLERADLAHVRELSLEGLGPGSGGVASLRRSSALPTLAKLRLDVPLDAPLVALLAERAPNLEDLELAGATGAGLHAFADSSLPTRLRAFVIGRGAGAGAVDAGPLVAAPFRRLETLRLDGVTIDEEARRSLASSAAFVTVADLDLPASRGR